MKQLHTLIFTILASGVLAGAAHTKQPGIWEAAVIGKDRYAGNLVTYIISDKRESLEIDLYHDERGSESCFYFKVEPSGKAMLSVPHSYPKLDNLCPPELSFQAQATAEGNYRLSVSGGFTSLRMSDARIRHRSPVDWTGAMPATAGAVDILGIRPGISLESALAIALREGFELAERAPVDCRFCSNPVFLTKGIDLEYHRPFTEETLLIDAARIGPDDVVSYVGRVHSFEGPEIHSQDVTASLVDKYGQGHHEDDYHISYYDKNGVKLYSCPEGTGVNTAPQLLQMRGISSSRPRTSDGCDSILSYTVITERDSSAVAAMGVESFSPFIDSFDNFDRMMEVHEERYQEFRLYEPLPLPKL